MESIYNVVGAFLSTKECETMFPKGKKSSAFLCEEHANYESTFVYPYKYALTAVVSFKLQPTCLICKKKISSPSQEEWPNWIFQVTFGQTLYYGEFVSYNEKTKMFMISIEEYANYKMFIAKIQAHISFFQIFTEKSSPLWIDIMKRQEKEKGFGKRSTNCQNRSS